MTKLFFEGDNILPDDVIQLEDLEASPAKLDDLKADVQDPLEEVNLGSEDHPKPIYVSQRLPEVVKNAYIDLLHECNSEEIAPYYMAARQLLDEFDDASLLHIPRRFNQEANELAQIATGIKIPQGWYRRTITIQKRSLPSFKRRSASMDIFTTDLRGEEEDWRTEIITFLKHPNLSSTKKIRERAVHYVLIGDELYKKSLEDDLLLKCVGPQESLKISICELGLVSLFLSSGRSRTIEENCYYGTCCSEVKLLWNIHTEVDNIKAELECIMSFLKDAESNPKLENERAKNWVKQVRALAFQIEDVMDEYVLHLAENQQRRGFVSFLRKLACSITKLKPKHDIASQIQDIKVSIREIKGRADRYGFNSLGHGSSGKIEEKINDDPRVASLFIEEDEVVGIESTREELIQRLIIEESNRTVTSLVGMGGCGKTTLAKTVFDDQNVFEHFDRQAWVSVSQSYNTEDIFRRMMKQLCETEKECAPEEIDTMDQNSLIRMLREYLVQKRYLIVFDDVWSTEFWRIIKISLPKNRKGSQIIVTTRSEDVASFCKESSLDHICKLEPLIEEEAWKLFCMKAFQWDFGGRCPPELEKVSRAIIKKCEGLPLAIVTIGALLSTKIHEIILTKSWELSFCQVLGEADRRWNDETRRWSLHMLNITNKDLDAIRNTKSRIRSFFLFSVGELQKNLLLSTLAMNFKLLKVLDLEDAPVDQIHQEVGNLLHLRYLSIKRTNVRIIPKFIGNLHNLQTLNLKYSLVDVLEIGILSRLHKLRHLITSARDCEKGFKIQGGIGHLEELQTLWHMAANDDEEGFSLITIKELENLRQLRKLGILNLKRENGKALSTAIEKMKHLQSLRACAINSDEILDLSSLSCPPESLQFLSLGGRLERFPNWISKLDNLVSLKLWWLRLTGTCAIKALQALPNLIRLNLYNGYDGEQLFFNAGGFQKLKSLHLFGTMRLNLVIIEEGSLPVLSLLWIGRSPQLKEVPSGICNLRELKYLCIQDMPTEFLDRMKPDKGQDYWIVEHIPSRIMELNNVLKIPATIKVKLYRSSTSFCEACSW
ncbi:hypothetical protein Vadar_015505 [Vaccinium darrowii]|uniref:Uncharacterized protein n=1 Tax=Vaccinium darrowii TaxID=229202 RepID=A0ACB7YW30_9ERIC|nr:hypothetical protein Vadar_015505 [Vaccinium darrowii]